MIISSSYLAYFDDTPLAHLIGEEGHMVGP